jgi:hypothetical protein
MSAGTTNSMSRPGGLRLPRGGKRDHYLRVTAVIEVHKPEIERRAHRSGQRNTPKGKRDVYFEEYGKFVQTSVYDFGVLKSARVTDRRSLKRP